MEYTLFQVKLTCNWVSVIAFNITLLKTLTRPCKGTSRVSLSKSNEPVSTRDSISVCIMFLSFLTSLVCVMWYNVI